MAKQRLILLYGGRSAEREVSVLSAESVMRAVNYDRFSVKTYFITKDGDFIQTQEFEATPAADEIAVVASQDSADRQRGFKQDLCRVVADFRFFSNFGLSEAVWMVVQQVQNAKFHH